MRINRATQFLSSTLAGCLLLISGSISQAMTISPTTEALGISWTLSATDDVDATYSASYEIMFSVQADVPIDLSEIMDDGETISPT
jgi:hypothetical protein